MSLCSESNTQYIGSLFTLIMHSCLFHMQVCENDAGVRLIQSNGILPTLDFSPEISYNSGEKFFRRVIICVPLIIPS